VEEDQVVAVPGEYVAVPAPVVARLCPVKAKMVAAALSTEDPVPVVVVPVVLVRTVRHAVLSVNLLVNLLAMAAMDYR
jgi:hypothetical protein